MSNEYQRLKEEADIEQVVEHLGISVTVRGTAKFILCPLPDHNDRHPTNCYFKSGWNNVYCMACGKSIQAIDLIMYTQGCSYGEAADLLWEIEGCPDWYYNDRKGKKTFHITVKEAQVLGIHLPRKMKLLVCSSPEKQPDYECGPDDLWFKKVDIKWDAFLSEEEMKSMVRRSAVRKIAELDSKRRDYDTAVKACYESLKKKFPGYDLNELMKISKKYEGFPQEEYLLLKELLVRAS